MNMEKDLQKIGNNTMFVNVRTFDKNGTGKSEWFHSDRYSEIAGIMEKKVLNAEFEHEVGISLDDLENRSDKEIIKAFRTVIKSRHICEYFEFLRTFLKGDPKKTEDKDANEFETLEDLREFTSGLSLIALRGETVEADFFANIFEVLDHLKTHAPDMTVEEIYKEVLGTDKIIPDEEI